MGNLHSIARSFDLADDHAAEIAQKFNSSTQLNTVERWQFCQQPVHRRSSTNESNNRSKDCYCCGNKGHIARNTTVGSSGQNMSKLWEIGPLLFARVCHQAVRQNHQNRQPNATKTKNDSKLELTVKFQWRRRRGVYATSFPGPFSSLAHFPVVQMRHGGKRSWERGWSRGLYL